MSNSNVAIFSATARKPFTGMSLDGVIAAVLPATITGAVKPSDIHLNGNTVAASLGGALTPVAFATGAAWIIARHAHGAKITVMTDGINEAVKAAIVESCHGLSIGRGIDAQDLRVRIKSAFAALLALPSKREKAIVNTSTSTSTSTDTTADTTADTTTDTTADTTVDTVEEIELVDVHVTQVHGNEGLIAAESAHDVAWAMYGDQMAIAHHAAIVTSEQEAEHQARVDAGFRSLNAEVAGLRALLDQIAECTTIKAVHAVLLVAGIKPVKAKKAA